MAFNDDGTLRRGDRPNQPQGWRRTQGAVLHHMIDWSALRETWNGLVRFQLRDETVRYLDLVGYGDTQSRADTVDRILDGTVASISLEDRDELAMRLCWQRYNLFEGPTAQSRPVHSPDPARMMQYFREVGATTFDFPIVAPPHGQRANTLWRASRQLAAFSQSGERTEARRHIRVACQLIASVKDWDVIPAYEVNWFGLSKKRFWRMNRARKQLFFQACISKGWRTADPDAIYNELFA
jgi:hypothetical protein